MIEPGPLADHRLTHRLHPEERADLVDRHYPHVLVERRRRHSQDPEDARVVDEHVDDGRTRPGRGHDGVPVAFAGDVVMAERGALAQLLRHDLAVVFEHVAQHHLRAFGDEQPGLRRALPACRTRDQRHLAVESSHRPILAHIDDAYMTSLTTDFIGPVMKFDMSAVVRCPAALANDTCIAAASSNVSETTQKASGGVPSKFVRARPYSYRGAPGARSRAARASRRSGARTPRAPSAPRT